jgi:hypothetical protein
LKELSLKACSSCRERLNDDFNNRVNKKQEQQETKHVGGERQYLQQLQRTFE